MTTSPTNAKPNHILHLLKKAAILALKIGVGSAAAIYIAALLGLENPASAGTVTLLTLINTKRGTVELIIRRYASFLITTILCIVLFFICPNHYMAFGIFLVLIVFITEWLKWGATLSVNALIGMHFMAVEEISLHFIANELTLLTIGVILAFALNLFNNYQSTIRHLYDCIVHTELEMRTLLEDLVRYIHRERKVHPWRRLNDLEQELEAYIREARKFQDDTFSQAPACFISYFEMRLKQYHIIENLHLEIRKIRFMPNEAAVLANYLEYMIPYVQDHNVPIPQIEKLEAEFEELKNNYSFASRQEFEDRAILFHILMDLQDFLHLKKSFLENLSEEESELFFAVSAHDHQEARVPSVR